jgi:hypothetical protein
VLFEDPSCGRDPVVAVSLLLILLLIENGVKWSSWIIRSVVVQMTKLNDLPTAVSVFCQGRNGSEKTY